MISLQKRIDEFNKLSKENRYKKVLAMLEILKENDSFFQDFFDLLDTLKENIQDELLESIYSMIVSAMIAMEEKESKEILSKLSKTSDKLKKLRELEEKQRQEEDPDKLLEEIL